MARIDIYYINEYLNQPSTFTHVCALHDDDNDMLIKPAVVKGLVERRMAQLPRGRYLALHPETEFSIVKK